eukprot:snap_masked-scaffold_68-processed-gene-0.79-mRNA-1 protein AED:0.01 eAED:0.01 QI:0/-1/0/1/-1/1/1/0/284
MGRHLQVVLGSAGAGKSSYCKAMEKHLQNIKRHHKIVNLDPAAESFDYDLALDIRDAISLKDVQDEENLDFGPNGGLVYCMETLLENINWLKGEFENIVSSDDEYVIVDCPGQVELVTHLPVMRQLLQEFQGWNFHVCVVYLVDSTFLDDPSKYISATLIALSAMAQLEVAHVNLLSKFDLLEKFSSANSFSSELLRHSPDPGEGIISPSIWTIRSMLEGKYKDASPRFKALNNAICTLLEEYSMVNFLPFDISNEEVIEYVLLQIDAALQYGDDVEPRTRDFE